MKRLLAKVTSRSIANRRAGYVDVGFLLAERVRELTRSGAVEVISVSEGAPPPSLLVLRLFRPLPLLLLLRPVALLPCAAAAAASSPDWPRASGNVRCEADGESASLSAAAEGDEGSAAWDAVRFCRPTRFCDEGVLCAAEADLAAAAGALATRAGSAASAEEEAALAAAAGAGSALTADSAATGGASGAVSAGAASTARQTGEKKKKTYVSPVIPEQMLPA